MTSVIASKGCVAKYKVKIKLTVQATFSSLFFNNNSVEPQFNVGFLFNFHSIFFTITFPIFKLFQFFFLSNGRLATNLSVCL